MFYSIWVTYIFLSCALLPAIQNKENIFNWMSALFWIEKYTQLADVTWCLTVENTPFQKQLLPALELLSGLRQLWVGTLLAWSVPFRIQVGGYIAGRNPWATWWQLGRDQGNPDGNTGLRVGFDLNTWKPSRRADLAVWVWEEERDDVRNGIELQRPHQTPRRQATNLTLP